MRQAHVTCRQNGQSRQSKKRYLVHRMVRARVCLPDDTGGIYCCTLYPTQAATGIACTTREEGAECLVHYHRTWSLAVTAWLFASSTAWAQPLNDSALLGVWRNPADSVHLALSDCGDTICGRVHWASEKAKADARRAGTDPLIGIDLLRSLERAGDGRWRGQIFVPDLRREVAGTITLLDGNTLRVRSCVIGVLCRTQHWTRLPSLQS